MADLLAGLSPEQMATQTLCDQWTIHELAGHLVSYLRFGQLKVYLCMVAGAGDFAPGNERFARWYARRSDAELVDLLRRHAESRTTIPRSGYDPILTDVVLHDLDIRIPLGIERPIDPERLSVAFHHLATIPAAGYAVGGRLRSLRFETTDTGWTAGDPDGLVVRGPAQRVVMAMSGRVPALDDLEGHGVPLLRDRLATATRIPLGRRMAKMAATVLRPSARRGRDVEPPALA